MQIERVISANHQVLDYAKYIMSVTRTDQWLQFKVRVEKQSTDPENNMLVGECASERTYTGPLDLQIQFVFLDHDVYRYIVVDTRYWRTIGAALISLDGDKLLECESLSGFIKPTDMRRMIELGNISNTNYRLISVQDFKMMHIPGGIFNMHFVPRNSGISDNEETIKPFVSMTNQDKVLISSSMIRVDLIRDRTRVTITPVYDI